MRSAHSAVADAPKDVLDLSRTEFGIDDAERSYAAKNEVETLQPVERKLGIAQKLRSERDQACPSIEVVVFVTV